MKPIQNENSLIFANVPTFWRRIGIIFLVFALASFLFAYFGAIYFGGEITSIIAYAVISVVVGIVFSFCGLMLVFAPDKKLEINTATGKIILTKKLFRTSLQELSIGDVEKVEFIKHDLENSSIYLPQIILRGGQIVEIPSGNTGDEKKQMEIFERVRSLLLK